MQTVLEMHTMSILRDGCAASRRALKPVFQDVDKVLEECADAFTRLARNGPNSVLGSMVVRSDRIRPQGRADLGLDSLDISLRQIHLVDQDHSVWVLADRLQDHLVDSGVALILTRHSKVCYRQDGNVDVC